MMFVLMLLLSTFWKASSSWSHFQFRDFVHKFSFKVRVEMGKKTGMMREQKQRNWRQVSEVMSLWFQAEEPERRQKLNLDPQGAGG